MIAQVKIDGIYLGKEQVTVKAGTFAARHFQFVDPGDSGMAGKHPPYDLWVTDDEDSIFLKGGVGGYMMLTLNMKFPLVKRCTKRINRR